MGESIYGETSGGNVTPVCQSAIVRDVSGRTSPLVQSLSVFTFRAISISLANIAADVWSDGPESGIYRALAGDPAFSQPQPEEALHVDATLHVPARPPLLNSCCCRLK
jgi:hypothetical protein